MKPKTYDTHSIDLLLIENESENKKHFATIMDFNQFTIS